MKVTLNQLYNVGVENPTKFSVASALAAKFCEGLFDYNIMVEPSGWCTDGWSETFQKFNRWLDQIGYGSGLIAVSRYMGKDDGPQLLARMFMFWEYLDVKDTVPLNKQIEIPSKLSPVLDYLFENKSSALTDILEAEAKGGKNIPLYDRVNIFFAVVCHHTNAVLKAAALANSETDKKLQQEIRDYRKLSTKYDKVVKDLECCKNRPPIVQEVVVRNTEREDALYEELVAAQTKITQLEDKLAVYDVNTSTEDFAVMEELYEEEQDDIDLSQYKILIIGSYENKDAYPFPYIECHSDTAILSKIDYVDYVLFDTRVNSHHTYFSVKQRCKSVGVKMFHINNRNKDIILSEAKRLISTCK